VSEIGEDRFSMLFRIVSTRHQRIAAEGDSVIVAYDYRLGAKVSLPSTMRAAIEALEATRSPATAAPGV
jgi:acyl-CoA thioester hydrolase